MSSTLDLLDRLATTTSRTDKEQMLFAAFMRGERDLFVATRLALDPLVTFGVQKVARIEGTDEGGDEGGDEPEIPFADFLRLAHQLRKRELTGHAARDAINAMAANAPVRQWNDFYRRILLKDFKIGVEAKTINKILKKCLAVHSEAESLLIPLFTCQLAEDGKSHEKKLVGEKLCDVKLDGARLLTVLDKETNTVTQFTRNGKVNENFPHIRQALEAALATFPASVVLDGEIVASSFAELMTQINRKDEVNSSEARLALFDAIPLSHFRAGYSPIPQTQRHEALTHFQMSGILREHCGESVFVVPKMLVDLSSDEGQAAFKAFNNDALASGYEGIMIKDPQAPYEGKRSTAWLKLKPVISVSLTIVALNEGDAEGKYQGTLGAFVLEGEDNGRRIATNCGTGLSDADRHDFWARRAELVGLVVEIEADAFTLEQGSEVFSLRFPRFKGFRGSEPGEKL